jgi:hypothetical protein
MLNEVLQHVQDKVRQECDASNARLREEFEQRLSQREIDDGAQGSPMLNRSSCGSTGVPEQDALRRWPVDEIDAPKPCKLYVQEGFIKTKVAAGQAYPTPAGSILHCRPIPAGYAKVALDALVKKSYGKVELDFASNGESKKLKHNIGSFVAWRKRYISFDSSDSDSSDDSTSGNPPMPSREGYPTPLPAHDATPPSPQDPTPTSQMVPVIPPPPQTQPSNPKSERSRPAKRRASESLKGPEKAKQATSVSQGKGKGKGRKPVSGEPRMESI